MPLILRVSIFSSVRSIVDWHIHRTILTRSEILYLQRVADFLVIEFFWFKEAKNRELKTIVSIFQKCRFRFFLIIDCRSLTLYEFYHDCTFIFCSYSDVSFAILKSKIQIIAIFDEFFHEKCTKTKLNLKTFDILHEVKRSVKFLLILKYILHCECLSCRSRWRLDQSYQEYAFVELVSKFSGLRLPIFSCTYS